MTSVDEARLPDYLRRVLKKEAFDGSGLVYGIGQPSIR